MRGGKSKGNPVTNSYLLLPCIRIDGFLMKMKHGLPGSVLLPPSPRRGRRGQHARARVLPVSASSHIPASVSLSAISDFISSWVSSPSPPAIIASRLCEVKPMR